MPRPRRRSRPSALGIYRTEPHAAPRRRLPRDRLPADTRPGRDARGADQRPRHRRRCSSSAGFDGRAAEPHSSGPTASEHPTCRASACARSRPTPELAFADATTTDALGPCVESVGARAHLGALAASCADGRTHSVRLRACASSATSVRAASATPSARPTARRRSTGFLFDTQHRLLPAVLGRDGAAAAHGRRPGARRHRLQPGLLRRAGRASSSCATSTPIPGSRHGSPASAGSRSTRPRRVRRHARRPRSDISGSAAIGDVRDLGTTTVDPRLRQVETPFPWGASSPASRASSRSGWGSERCSSGADVASGSRRWPSSSARCV